jgi:hypothetical protein
MRHQPIALTFFLPPQRKQSTGTCAAPVRTPDQDSAQGQCSFAMAMPKGA